MENTLNRGSPTCSVLLHFLPFETGANNALILDTTRLECFRKGFFDGRKRRRTEGRGRGEGRRKGGGGDSAAVPVAGIRASFHLVASFRRSSFLSRCDFWRWFVCQLDVCPDEDLEIRENRGQQVHCLGQKFEIVKSGRD